MTRITLPRLVKHSTLRKVIVQIRRHPTLLSIAVLASIVLATFPVLRTGDSYHLLRSWLVAFDQSSPAAPVGLQVLSVDAPQITSTSLIGEWRRVNEPAHIVLRFEQDQVLGFYKTQYKGSDLSLCIAANYPDQSSELLLGTIQTAIPSLDPASESLAACRFPRHMFEARFHLAGGQLTISDVKSITPPDDDKSIKTIAEVLSRLNGEYQSLTAEG